MDTNRLDTIRSWMDSRRMTIGLGTFLLLWFGFQQLVYHSAGEPIATWLFYYEMPPEHVSPGMVLMVISHDMQNLTHLVSNLTLLLAVGSIIEPRIGGRKLLWLVLPVGLLGTYLANLTVVLHHTWMTAGASGGVLTLLAYTGLECWPSAQEFKAGVEWSRQGVERVIHVALLISIPGSCLDA